jgi:hypothetical protein
MIPPIIKTFDQPFRVRVILALEAALEEISIADGYSKDMAGAVLWGRVRYDEQDPLPMISLLEPPVPPEWSNSLGPKVVGEGNWPLLVQGFVKDDFARPTEEAYFLAADAKRRLAIEKQRDRGQDIFGMGPRNNNGSGNAVLDMFIGSEVIRPSDEQSGKAFFWLPLTLKIAENHLQPYS